jgi:hypothetical protein
MELCVKGKVSQNLVCEIHKVIGRLVGDHDRLIQAENPGFPLAPLIVGIFESTVSEWDHEFIHLLEQCKEAGMVHTVTNVVKGINYICNCCGCCCEMLRGTSLPTDETSQLMQSMAEDFIRNNEIEVKPIAELSLFPRLNLDEKSLSMIPSNVFGYDGLNQVFTGSYKLRNTSVTAFISHRKSPIQAKKLALKYYEFLKEYGAEDLQPDIQIKGARLVRILDTYELIFTKGPYLAGIHEATDRKQAERLGELLEKSLKEY